MGSIARDRGCLLEHIPGKGMRLVSYGRRYWTGEFGFWPARPKLPEVIWSSLFPLYDTSVRFV